MNRTSSPNLRPPLRRWLRLLLWAGLLATLAISAMQANAAEVDELYEAQVLVSGQDAEARLQAQRVALAEVLVRISGGRDAAAHPALAPVFADVARYVQQYRYVTVPVPGEEAGGLTEQQLWVRFDEAALEGALRGAGLPVWGRLRPSVIAWVALADGAERQLIGGEAGWGARELLERVARRRGVPLLFPILDLEDQARVRFADVWAGFGETVVAHSARYGANGVLVGRVYRDAGGRWSGAWKLHMEGAESRWEGRRDERDALLEEAADALADALAARFALHRASVDEGGVEMRVEAVAALADFVRLERYLRSLPPVTGLRVERVGGEAVRLRIEARGGREALMDTIALGRTLSPAGSEGTSGALEALHYRLNP